MCPAELSSTADHGVQAVAQALFDKSGRENFVDNSAKNRHANTLGRDDKPLRCRYCGSFYQFLRDCDKVKESVLVNIVHNGALPLKPNINTAELTQNRIFDIFQNLPEEFYKKE